MKYNLTISKFNCLIYSMLILDLWTCYVKSTASIVQYLSWTNRPFLMLIFYQKMFNKTNQSNILMYKSLFIAASLVKDDTFFFFIWHHVKCECAGGSLVWRPPPDDPTRGHLSHLYLGRAFFQSIFSLCINKIILS